MDWDTYLTEMCRLVAKKSKDESTKVGCVIVGPNHEIRSTGYNGFVRGADDEKKEWRARPKKYKVTAHAELNAVANAARIGTPLNGCTAYVSLPPCSGCAIALAQSGIKEVRVLDYPEDWSSLTIWREEFEIAEEILAAANVMLVHLS